MRVAWLVLLRCELETRRKVFRRVNFLGHGLCDSLVQVRTDAELRMRFLLSALTHRMKSGGASFSTEGWGTLGNPKGPEQGRVGFIKLP